MISVLARDGEHAVVAEFFELLKTPWSFYQPGAAVDVLLCTLPTVPPVAARLVLHYSSATEAGPGNQPATGKDPTPSAWVRDGELEFPLYGPCQKWGQELWQEAGGESGRTIRIGYELFAEIHQLLTQGQPLGQAACPTLDGHIELLRRWLTRYAAPWVEIPPVPHGHPYIVCLTHDVDHVGVRNHRFDHTMAGFLARATLGSLVDLVRGKKTLAQLGANWLAVLKLPLVHLGLARDFWYQFDEYVALEQGVPSTFFVIPKKGVAGVKAPPKRAASYTVRELQPHLQRLESAGKEIGVHGLDAWHQAAAGREEQQIIRELVPQQGKGIRMHWLYFSPMAPQELEAAGYDYDSTVGYNATVGYRAGTAQVFKPLLVSKMLELPMLIMDTALFYPSYLNLSPVAARERLAPLLAHARQFGGTVTINWHDRSIAPERLWGQTYGELIGAGRQAEAWFATAGQAVAWYQQRRSARFTQTGQRVGIQCAGKPAPGIPPMRLRIHAAPGRVTERELNSDLEMSLAC